MAEKIIRADLKIQLLANDVLVAESCDDKLWGEVLAAMQDGVRVSNEAQRLGSVIDSSAPSVTSKHDQAGVASFASDLGLEDDVVQGACSPSTDEPFIHLDSHCWESLKKNTPPRGANSIAAINLAATLLCLWFKRAGIEGNPTPAQAQAVLATIGLRDKNASRSVKNCEWLQSRGGGIHINPAKISKAKAVVCAYCTQQPIK